MYQANLFKRKTVFVKGGRSGIGYVIAKQFLTYGAKVIIASRDSDKMEAAHNNLKEIGDCHAIALNIRSYENVQEVVEKIKSEFGTIDILINNAGGQFPAPTETISPKGWNAVIDINLNGTWNMTHSFANAFCIPQKSGIIINVIANIVREFPGMSLNRCCTRAGIDNLTKSLSLEWVHHNIRLNAIAPGIIDSTGLEQYPPAFRAAMEPSIPMHRFGSVDDIAYLALFLASPMSNYITGETIYVDGGQSLWGSMWTMPKKEMV